MQDSAVMARSAAPPVRVAQLSDTHFVEAALDGASGYAYDTSEAFDAVHAHLEANHQPDLVVVTGDIADHGRPAQYRRAAQALSRFNAPVNVCPGNHDRDAAFTAGIGRPGVATSRVIEVNNWCFLFADSNAGVMVPDPSGRPVDPQDFGDRMHRNGSLGNREASWIREMCASTDAEHLFIWVHHPPAAPIELTRDDAYAQEWRGLLGDLASVRGLAGGHTHVPDAYTFENRPVFVSPALKNNFDLQAKTLLPPGYRTYEFGADGSVSSELHLLDDDRWPRNPLGRAVVSLFNGELTYAELEQIVRRKQRG